jgi:colanic acid/amylovoran biosynthesis glycosyltransferase
MPPIGYLTDHYPAVSHTFIQREVLALRRRGIDVRTFSIHRVGAEHVLSREDHAAFTTTTALLPVGRGALVWAHVGALARHPRAYLGALRDALRTPAESPRGRLWQVFYFAEAVLLWRACRRAGIRHVHAHFTSPAADVAHHCARFARRARRGQASWSFSAHGVDIDDADQAALAEKVRDADLVVCVSDAGRSRLMALVDEPEWSKLQVVHCGVDLEAFPPVGREASAGFSILSVGRLVAVKGYGVLVEAVASLVAADLDARLTLVGDGPQRGALEAFVSQRGLSDRVRFAGRVGQDEIGAYYRAADVFCLPSFAEGVPVVLMEAMASGLPVVSTRVNGIPELVEDGVSGLLVAPGRSDLLAAALRELAEDPAHRAELGQAGRARVAEAFEVDACAAQLAGLFAAFG